MEPHCNEDRSTKLLLPTLLPNRWLTLYLNKKVKLGKLQKRMEKDIIDDTFVRKMS